MTGGGPLAEVPDGRNDGGASAIVFNFECAISRRIRAPHESVGSGRIVAAANRHVSQKPVASCPW